MNGSQARIRGLAGLFGYVALGLLGYLAWLMLGQHELWSLRSHQNRWAFRAVPSLRGSITDRHGQVLVADEPTTRLAIYYERFRLRHPVGAAVHGATLLGEIQSGGGGPVYAYRDGVLGPTAAAAALLALPVRLLKRGVLPKGVAAELGTLATTVLAGCSGQSRRAVFTAMREAASANGDLPLGEVLPGGGTGDWLVAFADAWQLLCEFDAELSTAARPRTVPDGSGPPRVLLAELDRLRELSLLEVRVQQRDQDGKPKLDDKGKPKLGDLYESIAWPFADQVPFELAARLRVGRAGQPGFEVLPSVRRIYHPDIGPSLRALLGAVQDVDKTEVPRASVANYLQNELPDDWLVDIVPEGVAESDAEHERLHAGAQATVARAVLTAVRRGINGVEAEFEEHLNGRLGMRLVERDARRRELQLWGAMQVVAGDALQLTLDAPLQQLAERVAQDRLEETRLALAAPEDRELVDVGLCLLDARTGDILAVAGAPVVPSGPRSIPGVGWRGNGAIGSVVKPLVLLELLQRENQGKARRWHTEFAACTGKVRIGGRLVGCAVGHGSAGNDAVRALATSCNSFFFECAEELGVAGLAQSMQRFGLRDAPAGVASAAPLAPIPGLRVAPWRWVGKTELPRRAIGYGVAASTVEIARAYAALATGVLPEVAIVRGPARPGQALVGLERECEVVRAGLRECVDSGTAKALPLLRQLGVHGKTGTAEVSDERHNNAWFAGYLPQTTAAGVQLCFCAVVYRVPHGVHGAEAAAQMIEDLLRAMLLTPGLATQYVLPEGGR